MRLIDADVFIEKMKGVYEEYMYDVLDETPTVDAVPVVRCKDCRFRDTHDCGMQFYGYDDDMNLRMSDDWTYDNGFCYWGEKKVVN